MRVTIEVNYMNTKEPTKNKKTTEVYTERHPVWLDTEVPPEYEDEDLFKIILFFVFYSPCQGQSQRHKPLTEYGWKENPWNTPSYLKDKLNFIIFGNNPSAFFYCKAKSDFKKTIEKNNFNHNFYLHRDKQRIALVNTKNNIYMSFFHHIRNSLAHGRIAMYPAKNNDITFVMEDGENFEQDKFKVTARIIINKSTLLDIISLLKSGPKEENNYHEDILSLIENGTDTKKK